MMPLTRRLLIPLTALLAVFALAAPSAFASSNQISIVQDNNALNSDPSGTMKKLQEMGVKMVKYAVYWNEYAVNANAKSVPAADTTPQAYLNHQQFGLIDEIDQAAARDGIKLGLMITSPAPRWAETSTAHCSSSNVAAGSCHVSTADFENFVKALGTRYSGTYPGIGGTLPKISWWSVWNEPNYVPNLSPQQVGPHGYAAAAEYRGLLEAAWTGLHATGHAHDTFIFGELAPRRISGGNAPNQGAAYDAQGSKPVAFLAALYCETISGRRFSGPLARANNCPTNPAAFKRANPALFNASGVADHPYSQGVAPNLPTFDCKRGGGVGGQTLFCQNPHTHQRDPLWTELGSISNLENGLFKDLRAYGSHRRYAIWNTEYGYWTSPTGHINCRGAAPSNCDLSPAVAADYLNWAEYISYKNPRIVSFDQYQLYQPSSGNWTDGLLTPRGVPLLTYDAWLVPLFMPTTIVRHPANLIVWGGVRPAAYDGARTVQIQFKGKSGGWRTLTTVKLANNGYFTTRVRFTASGSVRLVSATATAGSLISRTQAITVR